MRKLGVEADRVAPFSDELVRTLAATGWFARVDRLDRFTSPPGSAWPRPC